LRPRARPEEGAGKSSRRPMTALMATWTICVVPRTLALVHSSSRRTDASPCSATSVAVEALVRRYLPLASSLARRYAGRGEAIEDLVQVANLGLVKAARRFDERRGIGFSTMPPM
jgi:DNA-directed RNA polymerase sigma subunit (sigma70/sigma32)